MKSNSPELVDAVNKARWSMMGIPKRFLDVDFDNVFGLIPAHRQNHKLYEAALEYSKLFNASGIPSKNLVLTGSSGVGKTQICCCLMKAVGFGKMYMLIDILNSMRAKYDGLGASGAFDNALTCELLVLDDLGREKMTQSNQEWVREALFTIVDYRYREMLPIVVSSNLSVDDLSSRYGEPTISRLVADSEIVYTVAKDGRQSW